MKVTAEPNATDNITMTSSDETATFRVRSLLKGRLFPSMDSLNRCKIQSNSSDIDGAQGGWKKQNYWIFPIATYPFVWVFLSFTRILPVRLVKMTWKHFQTYWPETASFSSHIVEDLCVPKIARNWNGSQVRLHGLPQSYIPSAILHHSTDGPRW